MKPHYKRKGSKVTLKTHRKHRARGRKESTLSLFSKRYFVA